MKLKTSPEIKKVIEAAVASGEWMLEDGKKHGRLRHVRSNRFVTYAGSSSDRQACLFFKRDLIHVEKGIPGWGQNQEVTANICLKR